MPRYFVYFAVALFMFSIGVFAAFQISISQKQIEFETKSNSGRTIKEGEITRSGSVIINSDSLNTEDNELNIPDKKKSIICKDKTISRVWKQLQNSSADFWDWVNPTMEFYDCARMFEAKRIDLNNDGIKEIKIRGQFGNFCGATGNCSEWVFGRTVKSGKYKLLLYSNGEYFYLRRKTTNSYRDIYITTHASGYSSYHFVYKFNGKNYRKSKCWYEEYWIDGEKQAMSCAEREKRYEEEQKVRDQILKSN